MRPFQSPKNAMVQVAVETLSLILIIGDLIMPSNVLGNGTRPRDSSSAMNIYLHVIVMADIII